MPKKYYTGEVSQARKELEREALWKQLPPRLKLDNASGYVAQPGLVDAVNVALTLNQPLLLTGEPGTGKSTLASSVAYELGCIEGVLKVDIKSTTSAKDLFYTFDHIAWFNTRHIEEKKKQAKDFLTLTGLGQAIVNAAQETPNSILPVDYSRSEPKRSVVLIDEIDKAPRDVPNDLLNEIDKFEFRIPEIDNVLIKADENCRPIIIITSNSEKSLPDAFLRRCIFYNIDLPDDDTLLKILVSRFSPHINPNDQFFSDAISFMHELRKSKELDKQPGVAELIDFVEVTHTQINNKERLKSRLDLIEQNLSTMVKNPITHMQRQKILLRWTSS